MHAWAQRKPLAASRALGSESSSHRVWRLKHGSTRCSPNAQDFKKEIPGVKEAEPAKVSPRGQD